MNAKHKTMPATPKIRGGETVLILAFHQRCKWVGKLVEKRNEMCGAGARGLLEEFQGIKK